MLFKVSGILALMATIALVGVYFVLRSQAPSWPKRIAGVSLEYRRPLIPRNKLTPDNALYYLRQLRELDARYIDMSPEEEAKLDERDEKEELELSQFRKSGFIMRIPVLDQMEERYSENIKLLLKAGRSESAVGTQLLKNEDFLVGVSERITTCKIALYFAARQNNKADIYIDLLNAMVHSTQEATVLSSLVAHQSIREIAACVALESSKHSFTADEQKKISEFLINAEQKILPISEAYKSEKYFNDIMIDMLYDEQEIGGFAAPLPSWAIKLLQSNRGTTKRHFADFFTNYVAVAEDPFSSRSREILSRIKEHNKHVDKLDLAKLCSDDPIGWGLATIVGRGAISHMHDDLVEVTSILRTTAVYLGVNAYKQENGHLPEGLVTLVPKYLAAIPLDPYTNDIKPLQYEVKTESSWSVFTGNTNILYPSGPIGEPFRMSFPFISSE